MPEAQGESLPTAAMIEAETLTVPVDAPECMWDGLPRAIMAWVGFERPTPRSLFQHLRSSGYEVPAWMAEEGELKALDHVPSKGTRCVLIYRAMVENWRAMEATRPAPQSTLPTEDALYAFADAIRAAAGYEMTVETMLAVLDDKQRDQLEVGLTAAITATRANDPLVKATKELLTAAREVKRLGAQTGSQWFALSYAIIKADAALTAAGGGQ